MEEIVSNFIMTATRTERRPNIRNLNVFCNYRVARLYGSGYNKPDVTGSVSEIYIEPVISCVGDIDMMLSELGELVIPASHPLPNYYMLPTKLHGGFRETVGISEMLESGNQYPGYVFLRRICTIKRDSDGTQYSVDEWQTSTDIYRAHPKWPDNWGTDTEQRGPACRLLDNWRCTQYFDRKHNIELVYKVECPVWPPQAAEWETRSRANCWPDQKTIQFVVDNGCDVVPVTHRRCRQDELLNRCQWRLSFSRAEVVLLNSWTPVQQIVYHMLRYFVKGERLSEQTDDNGEKLMSNYHIKTVMLWAAEQKPQEWWNDDLNLVRICRQLLKTMAAWMDKAEYKHYFIPQCNLVDWEGTSQQNQHLISRLHSFTYGNNLADWFYNGYIWLSLQKERRSVLLTMLFAEIKSNSERMHAALTSLAATCCAETVCRQIFHCIDNMIWNLACNNFEPWLTRFHESCMELCTLDPCLPHAFTAAWCLQTAYLLQLGTSDTQLLAEICSRIQRMLIRKSLNPSKFDARLRNKLHLMEPRDCFQYPIALQPDKNSPTDLSLAFMMVNLGQQDSETVNCPTNSYLAAVYYSRGKYRSAIFHCKKVMTPHNHVECTSYGLETGVFPSVDADFDNVLGVAVLYLNLLATALNQHETDKEFKVKLTSKLFACYLHVKCLLKLQSSEMELFRTFQDYRELLRVNVEPFITDIILYQLLCVQLQHRTPVTSICLCQHDNINTTSTHSTQLHEDVAELRRLLVLEAVKELTTFREMEKQQFSANNVIVYPREFEAMHAYNDGLYIK